MSGAPRDWDAGTYERVSEPQLDWGREVLERLELRGDETVLDAGCGTGRVTRELLERLPKGRVIAVDGSPSMVDAVRRTLDGRAEVLLANLLELELAGPVDVVFSTATFHWILDHERLFDRLHGALRPGGRLVAQCGGEGNVSSFVLLSRAVSREPPFASHLAGLAAPTYFASATDTESRLRSAGFDRVRCWLEPKSVVPPEPREFLRSVCLGAVLETLPEDLRGEFVDAVAARMPDPPVLDYVRLNISARRPA